MVGYDAKVTSKESRVVEIRKEDVGLDVSRDQVRGRDMMVAMVWRRDVW